MEHDKISNPKAMTYRYFGIFRFLLAAMVMFHHFVANAAPMPLTLFFLPYEIGSIAVLVFFCLSGLVIIEAADAIYQGRPVPFMTNRMIRIFPHFLIAVTFSIALQWWFTNQGTIHMERMVAVQIMPDFSLKNILFNYFCLLPPFDRLTNYEFVYIAWAVRIEVVFYATIAFCLLIAKWTPITFPQTIIGASVLLLFPFGLTLFHHGLPTFGFLPYFVYGAALYYGMKGNRIACYILAMSVLGMFVQFIDQPWQHPTFGFLRDVPEQMIILGALIIIFTALAGFRANFQQLDNRIGAITYPLYMYHWVIFVPVTALFAVKYTYKVFIIGMLICVIFSIMMAKFIDPFVDHYRNQIRGMKVVRQVREAVT